MPSIYLFCTTLSPRFFQYRKLPETTVGISGSPMPPLPFLLSYFLTSSPSFIHTYPFMAQLLPSHSTYRLRILETKSFITISLCALYSTNKLQAH